MQTLHRIRRLLPCLLALAASSACLADESFQGKLLFFGNSDGKSALVETMQLDGTGLQTVLALDRENYRIPGGRLSPDGKSVAISVWNLRTKKSEIRILTPNGTHKSIFENDGYLAISGWSPDGKQIACFMGEHGNWRNSIVNVETKQVEKIALPPGDVIVTWLPDGKQFAVMAKNEDKIHHFEDGEDYPQRSIYLANLDGTRAASLTKNPQDDFIWARFSPDSKQVAYYHRYYRAPNDFKDGHALEACALADRDGSNSRDLACFTRMVEPAKGAQGIRPNGGPVWSPDGKQLIWIATKQLKPDDDDTFELVFVATDGTNVRHLPLGKERTFWGQIDCQ